MNKKESIKENLKSFWKWLWESESWWSYIVFLILVFIAVKFIFLPGLGLIFGTSLPLAIVESSSMDHRALGSGESYGICGKTFGEKKSLNTDEYWDACGSWYEENTNITKAEFQNFKFRNGFRKGDLMVIFGKSRGKIKIGDIIIFSAGGNYAHPIIHRVISLNPNLQTKGDHNPSQLNEEEGIQSSQIVGVAVAKIPYVGWIKLFFVEIWRGFRA